MNNVGSYKSNNSNSIYGDITTKTSPQDYFLAYQKHPKKSKKIIQTPDEARKTRNKNAIGLSIGGVTVLSALAILILKGPKGITKSISRLKDKANNWKLNSSVTAFENKFTRKIYNIIAKTNGVLDVVNNVSSMKDIIAKKVMMSSFGLKYLFGKINFGEKLYNWITDAFVEVAKSSVSNAYRKARELKPKMLYSTSVTAQIKGVASNICNHVEDRLQKVDEISNKVYDSVEAIRDVYLNTNMFKGFVAHKSMKRNVAEAVKSGYLKDLDEDGRSLFYSRAEKATDLKNDLMKIVDDVEFGNSSALRILNSVKFKIEQYKSGKVEARKVLLEEINGQLQELKSILKDDNNVVLKIDKFIEKIKKDDDLGAIQKYLDEIKNTTPEAEYRAIKKGLYKWGNAVRKAIALETIGYTEKIRDLTLGTAITDVLAVLIPVGTLGYQLSKTKSAEDRESVLLKFGFPAIAGIGVALYGNAKLYSGSRSILLALGSTFVLNKIGSYFEKILRSKDEADENNTDEIDIAEKQSEKVA